LADWFVYQHDGDYLGPWPTETVAHEILNGKLGPEVYVAAPGGERWVRAMDIPVIARLIDGLPTMPKPKRRDSGMFLRTSDDVDSAAATLRMPAIRSEEDIKTDPGMPPPTPTPNPTPNPSHTLESTGNRRRRKNG
jgi:hypothetical protein